MGELLSTCCSAKLTGEIAENNLGRCSDCKEMAAFTDPTMSLEEVLDEILSKYRSTCYLVNEHMSTNREKAINLQAMANINTKSALLRAFAEDIRRTV